MEQATEPRDQREPVFRRDAEVGEPRLDRCGNLALATTTSLLGRPLGDLKIIVQRHRQKGYWQQTDLCRLLTRMR